MLLKIYTLHDNKAEVYLQPFYARANGEAIRTFQMLCQDKNHQVGQSPGDFTLLRIGMFDQEKGLVAGLDKHENLGNGLDYIGTAE